LIADSRYTWADGYAG